MKFNKKKIYNQMEKFPMKQTVQGMTEKIDSKEEISREIWQSLPTSLLCSNCPNFTVNWVHK